MPLVYTASVGSERRVGVPWSGELGEGLNGHSLNMGVPRRLVALLTLLVVAIMLEGTSGRPRNGALRLVNRGGPAHHGLLQVYHHGRWGTICDVSVSTCTPFFRAVNY